MTINSYFYDSVSNDRPYSAADFARAFGIILDDGVIPDTANGTLGFTLGGTNFTTVAAGKATVQGHFVEIPEGSTEIITVPTGSYSGMMVIRIDITGARLASIAIRTDQTPQQDAAIWELPLYNLVVSNGVISSYTDVRTQGGAIAKMAPDTVSWDADINGCVINCGLMSGNGKPIRLFLTSAQPAASSTEIRAWIQIDKF
jgi:hypothetical protein